MINTLRFLAVDMVQKADSGHPGLPLGSATMAYTLWDRFLKANPSDPRWPDRGRFVLSAGHGAALLYALLHVTGFDLPLEELKRFRQWGSLTPAIQNTARRQAWKLLPVPSVRASATPSAWPLPRRLSRLASPNGPGLRQQSAA